MEKSDAEKHAAIQDLEWFVRRHAAGEDPPIQSLLIFSAFIDAIEWTLSLDAENCPVEETLRMARKDRDAKLADLDPRRN